MDTPTVPALKPSLVRTASTRQQCRVEAYELKVPLLELQSVEVQVVAVAQFAGRKKE